MADNTLQAIRTKIRRLTRSPSGSQISDAQIDEYVNTFILYDFPENVRLFSLRTIVTFYTQPNVDRYETNTIDPLDPLFNFKNRYSAIHPPVFFAGVQGFYTQWRDTFYASWPQTNTIEDTQQRGNGFITAFNGTLTAHPVLQNNVIFTANDAAGTGMILVDYPVSNTTGALGVPNQPQVLPSPFGSINYVTGVYGINFPAPVGNLEPVRAEVIAYQAGKPIGMLYYDSVMTLRPVPDKVYAVQIEADMRPTELLTSVSVPRLEQWWQYIALGAAIKILQDRLDMDSVAMIQPEFAKQESLVLRATLTQQANERTQTIYTQGKMYGFGWPGVGWPY
jgi:hypothetical protein